MLMSRIAKEQEGADIRFQNSGSISLMRHPCRAAIRSSPADVQARNAGKHERGLTGAMTVQRISRSRAGRQRRKDAVRAPQSGIDLQQIAMLVRCFIFDAERVGEGI